MKKYKNKNGEIYNGKSIVVEDKREEYRRLEK